MKNLFSFVPGFLTAVFLLCAGAPSARAILIGSSADNGNGTYTYSYRIDNLAGTFDIVAFSLEFNFLGSQIDWNQMEVGSGGGVNVPNANWIAQTGTPLLGLSAQDFLSIAPAGDVFTGTSLSGFSFTSAFAPGNVTYFYEFGALGESETGLTVGPMAANAVPEGGSSIAFRGAHFSLVFWSAHSAGFERAMVA